jgi:Cyclic nucleotide-binding domain
MTATVGVISLSWLPSELMPAPLRLPFDVGLAHYDTPPPVVIDDLEELRRAGRFRFVNRLRARVTVTDGRIVAVERAPDSGGVIGLSNFLAGAVRFPAVQMPDLVSTRVSPDGTFAVVTQTAGGRAPLPLPRLVRGRPRLDSPLVWTTLELVLHPDGTAWHRVAGASLFPRHWIYDDSGHLVEKVAVADADTWLHEMTSAENPWRGVDAAPMTAPAESLLERRLSTEVMRGQRRVRRLDAGTVLFEQGRPGRDVALLLDGVIEVERDGVHLAEIGPGAVLGERALFEGTRTSTVRALTDIVVAMIDGTRLDPADLEALIAGHRREDR